MQPQLGNTIALGFWTTYNHERYLPYYRIQYNWTNGTAIDSVLCSELYAYQIQKEQNRPANERYFTDKFGPDSREDPKYVWVCPNLNFTITLKKKEYIKASVVACDEAQEVSYANGTKCEDITI